MLNTDKYEKGMQLNELMKFNIAYDKLPLFNIICASLADKLLNSEYAYLLTIEERNKLQQIIDN